LKRDPIGNKHHLRSAWMNIGAQMLVHHWFWIINLYIYIYDKHYIIIIYIYINIIYICI
jgi:hypothetical protein